MICCVTGHRPHRFPFPYDKANEKYKIYISHLYKETENLIHRGAIHFITGMAKGVDIDFAYCVNDLRKNVPNITLEAALPFPFRKPEHPTNDSIDFERVLRFCDKIQTVSPYYHTWCMQKRNCYMVDRSDVVLAVWNGKEQGGTWNTIRYARSLGKEIRFILLNEI